MAAGGAYTLNTIDRPAVYAENQGGRDGGGKGPLIQTEKSATLSTLQDQTLFVPNNSGSDQPPPKFASGFDGSMGARAGNIGYEREKAGTLSAGKTLDCLVCGLPERAGDA